MCHQLLPNCGSHEFKNLFWQVMFSWHVTDILSLLITKPGDKANWYNVKKFLPNHKDILHKIFSQSKNFQMYSIMYVTHAFLHSKSAHCPFWQGAQGAPSICALLQDYNIATYLCFFILSFLWVYFLVCQPYTVFFISIFTLGSALGPGMFKIQFVNLGINKIPQFCQQFTKPTLATISWINMLPCLATLILMTVLFANFGYLQLTKHVAMFHNLRVLFAILRKDKNCQFWKLIILSILATDDICEGNKCM